ncbi:MAG: SDR family NAD(P)-dependent oxidoreductase [Treponema sp.]|jgi:sorbitol-6-phosphate 2-dehydrogenase|nr:SDR family NAD(P)-dependent oxidoreductase [Treponema sp.]
MTMDQLIIAPLVRGLCVNAAGEARTIVPGSAGTIPPQALRIDISSAISGDTLDEAAAAKALQEAYAAWEFENTPGGAEAVARRGEPGKQPSCIALTGGEEPAVYWIDRDIDAARKRRDTGNGEFLEGLSPPVSRLNALCTPGMSAAGRSAVVQGKTALVTGGAQGFGEEIVRGLAASGALVFIADLNLPGAEKLANTINAAQKRTAAIAVPVNVADEDSVEGLFKTVAETAGGLDICVSNAGILKAAGVLEQDLSSFKLVTDINYTGFFLMAKHCGRLLRRQHRTAPNWKTDIIQINSKSGLAGSNKNGAYAGGKFGSIGLAASFALELVEYNIKVNAICPGNFFDGPLWSDPEKGLFVQYLNTGKVPGARNVADVKAFYEAKVPMKRGCTGADVMRAIYYIIEQEYETGQAVPVTGGQVMLH